MRLLLNLAAAALAGLPLTAQLAPGALVDANVSLETTGLPTNDATTSGLFQNLRVAQANGIDHLYASSWHWRLDTDPREFALHDGDAQGPRSSEYRTNSVVHRWANVDHRGFAATLTAHAFSTGAATGMVIQKLTFTNNTNTLVRLNLFAYVDVDQCGAYRNSAVANPTGNRQKISDIACGTFGETYAPGADRFEVSPYRVVGGKLTDTIADDLGNTGLPLTLADYTAAWQWKDRALAPAASFTAYLILGEGTHHGGCLGVASASTFGVGKAGTRGVPTIDATALPLLGRVVELTVRNGYPGGPAYFVLGALPINVPFPPIGTILVNPAGAILFFGATFDGAGVSTTRVPIPNDGALCGATLHLQDFHFDPAAAGRIAHTARLTWVLGGVN